MGIHGDILRMAVPALAAIAGSHGLCAERAAADIAFQFSGTLTASGAGNDAFFFTVGSLDLLVTQLGEFNGTNESHTVAIYRTDAAFTPLELIISREITTTASYSGFQYVDVSDARAVLKADTKYFIVGNAGAGKQLVTGTTIGLGTGIKSFDAYRWNWSATPNPVTTDQSTAVYWGSNFHYMPALAGDSVGFPPVIPAPATLAGLACMIGLVRRRPR